MTLREIAERNIKDHIEQRINNSKRKLNSLDIMLLSGTFDYEPKDLIEEYKNIIMRGHNDN